MSRPRALSCPLCGGAVAPPLASRRLECKYCARALYYAGEDFMPRFALASKMSDADHQRACQKLFRHPLAPSGLGQRAVLLRKRRTYLPFYLLTGKRGGVLATGKERLVTRMPGSDWGEQRNGQGAFGGVGFESRGPEVVVEEDSRVAVGDFKYLYAAAALEGWAILDTDLRDAALGQLESARPARLSDLAKDADVVDADLPLERIVEKGVGAGPATKGTLALLELQVAIVYVPVMVFSFRYGQETFTLTLDELEGRMLAGQMPFRKDWAFLLAIPVVAGLGLICGNLLALVAKVSVHEWGASPGITRAVVIVGLVMAAALAIGLQAAWLLMRTPLVVKVTPKGPRVERAGPAPRNPFSPANALLAFIVKNALKNERRSGWDL